MFELLETNLGWLDVDNIGTYFYEGLRYLLGSLMWLISGAQTGLILRDRKRTHSENLESIFKGTDNGQGSKPRMILSVI